MDVAHQQAEIGMAEDLGEYREGSAGQRKTGREGVAHVVEPALNPTTPFILALLFFFPRVARVCAF